MSLRQAGWVAGVIVICVSGQVAEPDVLTITQERALHTPAYSWLSELSDSIGPRLTGSRSAERARDWALALMGKIGLEDVHAEIWPLKSGWARGRMEVELRAPIQIALQTASYGWTGPTPGGVEAEVVEVRREAIAEALPHAGAWKGKVVFVSNRPRQAGGLGAPDLFVKLVHAADQEHSAAVIYRDMRPGSMLTHTGPVSFSAGDTPYRMPVLDIAEEHQKLIERLLERRAPVQLYLNVDNRFPSGQANGFNISGEIRGTEHPEQVVLLAAHLDSWDLGTGAIDDGMGVATVLGAMEAIRASGAKPRRTVRVVLFTGEEQGLLGSQAWVRAHASEVPNLVCALALDWGQGPITALPVAGHEELRAELAPLDERLNAIQKFRLTDGFLTFTDAYTFTLVGVPGLAFYQDSRDYALVGHSAADTFDKVDPEILARNTATVAVAALWIANSDQRVGRTWTGEEIKTRLAELKQREMLEALGMWPSGK